jgi:hypothetical protein
VTLTEWLIAGVIIWLIAGTLAGLAIGRAVRGRDRQIPSHNHPTMQPQKRLTRDRPLDGYEAAKWAQLEQTLRTPDTQDTQ